MEREEDVEQKLGYQNVKLLLEAIKSGKLKDNKVKRISLKMHAHVHGVFVDKREQNNCELVDVMRNMLDQWALEELYKPEIDGLARLVQILEDVEEFPLAQNMKRHEIADQTSSLPEGVTGAEPNRKESSSSLTTPVRNAESVSTPSPAEEGERNRLLTPDYSVNIPEESVAPLCMPYEKLRPWTIKVCIFGLIVTVVTLIFTVVTLSALLLLKKSQTTGLLGVGGTSGKAVAWIKSCPGDKYTVSLSAMDRSLDNFGMIQVGDEIWVCGGDRDQTRSCEILSLKDGQWRPLEQKMNHPRIRPEMKVEGSKVIVQGGTTSYINSKTGCRNTQEVFDRDNPTGGWVTEDMEETSSCLRSIKQEVWADHLVWVDC